MDLSYQWPQRSLERLPSVTTAFGTVATLLLLAAAAPAAATAAESSGSDSTGDYSTQWGESYQDITFVSVSLDDGLFTFAMEVADEVPAAPEMREGAQHIHWMWALDLNTSSSPKGFPFGGETNPWEIFIAISYGEVPPAGVGAGVFSGIVVDRRPLVDGGDALVYNVSFAIDGTHLEASVDAGDLGDPTSFVWAAGTFVHMGGGAQTDSETHAVKGVDGAPAAGLATWSA